MNTLGGKGDWRWRWVPGYIISNTGGTEGVEDGRDKLKWEVRLCITTRLPVRVN